MVFSRKNVYSQIFLIVCLVIGESHSQNNVDLKPIVLSRLDTTKTHIRSLYDIDAWFTSEDTILFVEKQLGLEVIAIDSTGPHELIIAFATEPNLSTLGSREFFVIGSGGKRKTKAKLTVLWGPKPTIDHVYFTVGNHTKKDTLSLARYGSTVANMRIVGQGLFGSTKIFFEDPFIKVIDDMVHRVTFVPDSLIVQIVVESGKQFPRIGFQRMLINSPFTQETEKMVLIQGAWAPKITGRIRNIVADGTEQKISISGQDFVEGCKVSTVPDESSSYYTWISKNKIDFYLTLPILQRNENYRLVVTNPDGQADTSSYFIVMPKPLASAHLKSIDARAFFLGKKLRAEFVVKSNSLTRLWPNRLYEVNIEGQRFATERVRDDSTLVALIDVANEATEADMVHKSFTIGEVGKTALWKGILQANVPPKVNYMSRSRIVHPLDTLTVLIKGSHLSGVTATIDDPEIEIRIEESSNELVRLSIIAGRRATVGNYPLTLKKEEVAFVFEEYQILVQDWLRFDRYVGIQAGSLGSFSPEELWNGAGSVRYFQADDQILVRIFASKIPMEFGTQKVSISGMLTDSVSTVRAEAIDSKFIIIEPGNDIITWRFRVRQQIRSGDHIEITLQNPGSQNRVTEFFAVEPHWSEFFHGSASLVLFKIPFDGGSSTTEILKSATFGLSWQPWRYSKFIEFDMSFIVGNVATEEQTISVEVGLGLSAILWNHLQVGFGTNLTGDSFTDGFTFVATRFRLPVPWKP